MTVIFAAIGLAVVLAVAAGAGFYFNQEPIYRAQPTEGVRVGDPGHNLVGPNWSGLPPVKQVPAKEKGEAARSESGGAG